MEASDKLGTNFQYLGEFKMKTILKSLAGFMAFVFIFSLLSVKSFASTKEVDLYSEYYNSGNIFAQIGYYGQCTWYAYGRACEVNGCFYPFKWDAAKWYYYAKDSGEFEVGDEARANSIAVWSYYGSGHVAYVESVSGDEVTITEANNDHSISYKSYSLSTGIKQYDGYKTYSSQGMKTRYSKGVLLGYIYLSSESELELSDSSEVLTDITGANAGIEAASEALEQQKNANSNSLVLYNNNGYYSNYKLEEELIDYDKAVIMRNEN